MINKAKIFNEESKKNSKIVKLTKRTTKKSNKTKHVHNKTEEDYEDRNLNAVKQKARLVNQRDCHSGNSIKLLSAREDP